MRLSILKICSITAVLFLAVLNVFADDAHNKSILTTSKARVITPISLVNSGGQGIDFGTIAIGTMESKIVVSPVASVPVNVLSGDAFVLSSTTQKAASFVVSGEVGQEYSISLPASATLTSGTNTITISNFTCSGGITGRHIGVDNAFYVGGELTIPAGANPATYHGLFNLTVSYN